MLKENLLHSDLPTPDLPPVWQVIYREAVRGHHLLFAQADVVSFERKSINERCQAIQENFDSLSPAWIRLMSCPDLKSMRQHVVKLDKETKKSLYFLYCRQVSEWNHSLKDSLN